MSTAPQVGRQTKLTAKTRFHFLIENASYDWLAAIALYRGISVAKVLNDLLRELRVRPRSGTTS